MKIAKLFLLPLLAAPLFSLAEGEVDAAAVKALLRDAGDSTLSIPQECNGGLMSVAGKKRSGTGFAVKEGDKAYIVLSSRLLADNPGLSIADLAGDKFHPTGMECSRDGHMVRLTCKETPKGFFKVAGLKENDAVKIVNYDPSKQALNCLQDKVLSLGKGAGYLGNFYPEESRGFPALNLDGAFVGLVEPKLKRHAPDMDVKGLQPVFDPAFALLRYDEAEWEKAGKEFAKEFAALAKGENAIMEGTLVCMVWTSAIVLATFDEKTFGDSITCPEIKAFIDEHNGRAAKVLKMAEARKDQTRFAPNEAKILLDALRKDESDLKALLKKLSSALPQQPLTTPCLEKARLDLLAKEKELCKGVDNVGDYYRGQFGK